MRTPRRVVEVDSRQQRYARRSERLIIEEGGGRAVADIVSSRADGRLAAAFSNLLDTWPVLGACATGIYAVTVLLLPIACPIAMLWVLLSLQEEAEKGCDKPMLAWIYSLYCLLALLAWRKTIIEFLLCHDPDEDSLPEPCRVRAFNLVLGALAAAWPAGTIGALAESRRCAAVVVHSLEMLLTIYICVWVTWVTIPVFAGRLAHALVRLGVLQDRMQARRAYVLGALASLPRIDYDTSLFTEDNPRGFTSACPICLDSFGNGLTIVSTPCLHAFHKMCLEDWMGTSTNCPLCRTDIVEASRQLSAPDPECPLPPPPPPPP